MSKGNMSKSKLKKSSALSVRPKVESCVAASGRSPKFITIAIDQYSRSICGLFLPKS
jgi:hypothetical protein